MAEQIMVSPCRGKDAQSTSVFNTVIGKMDTAYSMAFYKARFAEATKRCYTILPNVADLWDHDSFQDVKLHFYVANDAKLKETTRVVLFQSIFKNTKWKKALESVGSNESYLKTIFNHDIEALDEWDR